MEILLKANKKEQSVWKSVNQLSDKYEKYANEIIKILFSEVSKMLELKRRIKKSQADAPLVFKGRIMYSPKDGKPIKLKEWKRLEDSIIKYLHIERSFLERKMTEDSYFLGNLLSRLSEQQRKKQPLSKFVLDNPDWEKFNYNNFDLDRLEVSKRNTGIYLQNVSDRMRAGIQSILIEGTKEKKPSYKVFQDLWDSEIDTRRDWDRVIRTETAMNSNNGMLISELRSEPEDEDIFMKGISAPGACDHCLRLIHNQVVVLLSEAPKGGGEKVEIDREEYIAIWPGKSNYGRNVKNYWTAVTIHPYCRCTWTRWYLELEGLEI